MAAAGVDDPEEAIRRPFAAGDYHAATEAFLRLYGREIYRYLRSECSSVADADDAYQEFSDRLWRKIDTFKGQNDVGVPASFKTWGYVVAHNALRTLGRGQERRRRRFDLVSSVAGQAPAPRSGTATFLKTESRNLAAELLAELSEEQRRLVQLKLLQGLSWEEIVAVLNDEAVSVEALRQRLSRAVKKLNRLAHERRAAG